MCSTSSSVHVLREAGLFQLYDYAHLLSHHPHPDYGILLQRTQESRANLGSTNDSWKEPAKPLTIHIEDRTTDELKALNLLTACTDEHSSSVRCHTVGTTLLSDEGLTLTDSSAMVFLCYPYREELSVDDTLHLSQPFGEQLYGIELSREKRKSIHVRMALNSSMTLLRIHITSDRLDALELYGESLITEADYMPFTGQWSSCRKGGIINSHSDDCLLNNGRNHDFYLVPNDMTMRKINIHTPLQLFLDDSSRHKTICRHLMSQGICSIAELCQSEEESLRTFGNINNRDIAVVKSSLACYGLHLDMGRSELETYMQGMPDIKCPETVTHASVSSEEWEQ